ncbi:MAG: ThuA domain-containing protein [Verrucomicrobiales bacterium]|nr:ThuA domain-containing protein [Verrucomicrobiales bacterium]
MKRFLITVLPGLAILGAMLFTPGCSQADKAKEKISVLLIDGQNNHNWVETSPVLVALMEQSGRFQVTVSTSPAGPPKPPRRPKEKTPESDQAFKEALQAYEKSVTEVKAKSKSEWEQWRPDFAAYDVVVSNYNGELWPEEVQKSFEAYVGGGGGFVSVHAANNAFPQWSAYNEMIGLGGWGGRSELSGPYLRLREGKWTKDMSEGRGGAHGKRHEFLVEMTEVDHPITQGIPSMWLHAEDELYDRLRGPAQNVTVLAGAFSDVDTGGSGETEPMLMTIDYGEGSVFHTTLGHDVTAMSSLGFQETLLRGIEWAATGEVASPSVLTDVLNPDAVSVREVTVSSEN